MSFLLGLLLGLPLCPWSAEEREEPPPGPNDQPGAFLYQPGSIHEFAFELSSDAIHALGRDEPDVHATLTYMGVSWDVGFKLKGSSTYQDLGGKPSIKIDLEQWVPDQKMLGVRRLTLNAMVFDPTMLREHAAYRLYELAGVPASRHGWARVSINGEDYGLYGIVETLDEQFLRRRFPGDSDGNLYDSTFTFADLTGTGLPNFELKEGKPLEPYADLHDLVDDIDSMDILELLDTRFDRDAPRRPRPTSRRTASPTHASRGAASRRSSWRCWRSAPSRSAGSCPPREKPLSRPFLQRPSASR